MGVIQNWAVISVESNIVVNTIVWDGEGDLGYGQEFLLVQSNSASIGDSYANGVFTPPLPPPLTPEQILANQSAILQQLNWLAAAQKKALTDRIATIQDAIDNIGVEGMEEFAATPAEEAELPVRKAQLSKWKNYAIALGRVTSQPGWPQAVTWPVQPAEGMDLSVSASAPEQQ